MKTFFYLYLCKTYWKQCSLFINAFITFKLLHSHTWKLLSTTAVLSAGQRTAPLERLGWRALLKGTSVMVMRRGQVLPFTFPTHIILSAGGLNRQAPGHKFGSLTFTPKINMWVKIAQIVLLDVVGESVRHLAPDCKLKNCSMDCHKTLYKHKFSQIFIHR